MAVEELPPAPTREGAEAVIRLTNVTASLPVSQSANGSDPVGPWAAIKALVKPNSSQTLKPVLKDISVDFINADRVGILGANGAGKSTLLRVLSGVLPITSGEVEINGVALGVMTAASGIRPDATGVENIVFNCLRLGIKRSEIRTLLPKIIADTGLGDAIDAPVREYSSGMRLRLSFAIATSVHPEIMIFDEWIGFGDPAFREHARNKLNEILANANVVVVASHNMNLLRSLCNRIIIMEDGRIVFDGPVPKGVRRYRQMLKQKQAEKAT